MTDKVEFNTCSHLIAEESLIGLQEQYRKTLNPLQDMLEMQNFLQNDLSKRMPERNIRPDSITTKGELMDFLDRNFDSIMDEYRELKTSIGGMSLGASKASAVWKPWKTEHLEQRKSLIGSLSAEDTLEMKFEMIDILHFVYAMLLALDMDEQEIYTLYMLKNKENLNRYANKY